MKQVIFSIVLLFASCAVTEMNAQSCCASKAACKSTASVEKGGGNGVAAVAVSTVSTEKNVNVAKPASSKKACAAACPAGAKSVSNTEKGANSNPVNCDPTKCDPAQCDPTKCKVEKGR